MIPSWVATLDSPPTLLVGVLLILLIVYSAALPSVYRTFADSLLGRALGVVFIAGILETMGWKYGLLAALAFLLVLHHAPRTNEGFDGGGHISEKRTVGPRWFVERILGRPSAISTDRVVTPPVQD